MLVKLALKHDGTVVGWASPRLKADPAIIALGLTNLPSFSMR